jgi:pyruvate,water dikinase
MKYEPIFKLPYSNVFITDLFVHPYAVFEPIITIKNGKWQFFLSEEAIKNIAEMGYEKALEKEAYRDYESKYKEFLRRIESLQNHELQNLTKEEFLKFLEEFRRLTIDFLEVYKETEFFYFTKIERELMNHIKDKFPFENLLSNKVDITTWPDNMRRLADYIINMQHIKLEYRKTMNGLALGECSLLSRILEHLVIRIGREDATSMTFEEVLSCFSNEKIKDVSERHVYSYIQWDKFNDKLLINSGGEAYRKIRELEKFIPKEEIIGTPACKGIVRGKVKIIPFSMTPEKYLSKMEKGDILVSDTTGPEMIRAIEKAAAIVTDEGGMMSHAAVISREFNIPCVVGTTYATEVFKDEDLIEVNANSGVVRRINKL